MLDFHFLNEIGPATCRMLYIANSNDVSTGEMHRQILHPHICPKTVVYVFLFLF